MLTLSAQDTRGGELCPSKYCQIFANSQYACSDRLFLTQQKEEVSENSIFTLKTSNPTEVKNHDLPHVGFSHNPLNGLETLQSNNHCYHLQLTRN